MKALALGALLQDELFRQVGGVVAGDLVALQEVGDGAAVTSAAFSASVLPPAAATTPISAMKPWLLVAGLLRA
jgi:hypothetical protein